MSITVLRQPHQLTKDQTGWVCAVCEGQWKGKPRRPCPEAKFYYEKDIPDEFKASYWQIQLNLKLKPNQTPKACYGEAYIRSGWLYTEDQLEIDDPTLPPAYMPYGKPYDKPEHLKTEKDLRHANLQWKRGAQPSGVYLVSYYRACGPRVWEPLYDLKDCEPGHRLRYITKGRLKDVYQLSASWLERLGSPDLLCENPHSRYAPEMQLYKRGRVEDFILAHIDEYLVWLERRQVYVMNGHKLAAKQGQTRSLQRQQMSRCFSCKCSALMDEALLCAVHPMGWPAGVPEEHLCPDWEDKNAPDLNWLEQHSANAGNHAI